MTTKQLIESLCLMFCVWSLRLAFLAAGCWMLYNGWYGCGLTTIILTILIGGTTSHTKEHQDDESSSSTQHYDAKYKYTDSRVDE